MLLSQMVVVVVLPPPLWLLLLLGGVWLSLSRADVVAAECWQGGTGPAGGGRRACRRLPSYRPCVFFCGAAEAAAGGRRCDGAAAAVTERLVVCRLLVVDARPPWPVSRRGAHGADGLVHSPSLTGWYTVCVCVW